MSGIVDAERRIDFNFAASTGYELSVSLEDYLDYVLDLPETRVVGFFMETSRHPEKLVAAFKKAAQKRIPIVALKVAALRFLLRWHFLIPALWREVMRLTVRYLSAMVFSVLRIWIS